MRSLTFISFTLLAACGTDPGTTATDSASGSTTNPATTSTATTDDPLTTTGDPAPTTSGASESATATTTTDATTTGPATTDTTGPVATDSSSTSTTGDAETSSSSGDESSSSGDTTGAIKDCATLKEAFATETLKIRSCKMPAECGQDLNMTSCGCTRNWVARKDADTTHFYDLLAQGDGLQCELIGPSICDCPEAEGFTCAQGICDWNYL